MNSLVFFGSLRSKNLLKVVIGNSLNHLEFYNAKIYSSKLFKVKNENFPYLQKTNITNDFANCTYIKGLTTKDFEKILFYESIEYKINKITINIDKKNIDTYFFELIKKNKTSELWFFDKWKILYEEFSCIAAKEWMKLFSKYKDNPGDAEIYWQKMLISAKKQVSK